MATITKQVFGYTFTFDETKDNLLKRGLIDPYLQGKSGQWVVLEEYIFWSASLQKIVVVPRWMITDLASIPALFRSLISVNDRHIFAALIHDFGYCTSSTSKFGRKHWDKVLKNFCKHFKVSWWKSAAIYSAVRVGGWMAWNKCMKHTDDKDLFIPEQHKPFYIDVHPNLKLPITNGDYLLV